MDMPKKEPINHDIIFNINSIIPNNCPTRTPRPTPSLTRTKLPTPTPTTTNISKDNPRYHRGHISNLSSDNVSDIECFVCPPPPCDGTINFDGQTGVYERLIYLGPEIGMAGIFYHANPPCPPDDQDCISRLPNAGNAELAIPDKFTITWNDQSYTTGYRGGSVWQTVLNDKLVELGQDPENIAGIGSGILLFYKNFAQPQTAILRVDSPYSNSRWSAQVICPVCTTPTPTPTKDYISSPTPTKTPTRTPTNTPSITPTITNTSTIQITSSPTPSITNSPTLTSTPTYTPTPTLSLSATATPTLSLSATITPTPTSTTTPTPTPTPTTTPTVTNTPTNTFTPTPTQTTDLLCNSSTKYAGSVGIHNYNIHLGSEIGLAGIRFHANPGPPTEDCPNCGRADLAVPERFTINWNGQNYTSGFRGSDAFDQTLLGLGYPKTVGIGSGLLMFNKTSSFPDTISVTVESPISQFNTSWEFFVECPRPACSPAEICLVDYDGVLSSTDPSLDGGLCYNIVMNQNDLCCSNVQFIIGSDPSIASNTNGWTDIIGTLNSNTNALPCTPKPTPSSNPS